jgi:hypothetical protein
MVVNGKVSGIGAGRQISDAGRAYGDAERMVLFCLMTDDC